MLQPSPRAVLLVEVLLEGSEQGVSAVVYAAADKGGSLLLFIILFVLLIIIITISSSTITSCCLNTNLYYDIRQFYVFCIISITELPPSSL